MPTNPGGYVDEPQVSAMFVDNIPPQTNRKRLPAFFATTYDSFNRFYVNNVVFFVLMVVLCAIATLLSVQLKILLEAEARGPSHAETNGDEEVTGYTDVVIGDTWDDKTNYKCVSVADNVRCDHDAEQFGRTGQYPDTFDIYRIGSKMCARRTDSDGPWGLHLVLRCKLVGESHPQTQTEEEKTYTTVTIGNSLEDHSSTKCVAAEENVFCSNEAEELGRTGEYPDKFEIYHDDGKICARRVDADAPWGLDLKIKCEKVDSSNVVEIGKSLEKSTKCVSDPGNVICDKTAEQLGRSGKFPDTFDIYHEDGKICAHRTDHDDPWGLPLVLKCKPKIVIL